MEQTPFIGPHRQVKILKCEGVKGRGVFAACDIRAGAYLFEYRGERIPRSISEIREAEYEAAGRPMTMVWLGEKSPKECIDAHRDENGQPFEEDENPARMMNHKRYNPNCVLRYEGDGKAKKCSVYTRRAVASGVELKLNYGDKSKDGWMDE